MHRIFDIWVNLKLCFQISNFSAVCIILFERFFQFTTLSGFFFFGLSNLNLQNLFLYQTVNQTRVENLLLCIIYRSGPFQNHDELVSKLF